MFQIVLASPHSNLASKFGLQKLLQNTLLATIQSLYNFILFLIFFIYSRPCGMFILCTFLNFFYELLIVVYLNFWHSLCLVYFKSNLWFSSSELLLLTFISWSLWVVFLHKESWSTCLLIPEVCKLGILSLLSRVKRSTKRGNLSKFQVDSHSPWMNTFSNYTQKRKKNIFFSLTFRITKFCVTF